MDKRYLVRPDSRFVKEVIGLGGDSLKQCFQCVTCPVTCPLFSDDNPFPRKEMVWLRIREGDELSHHATVLSKASYAMRNRRVACP